LLAAELQRKLIGLTRTGLLVAHPSLETDEGERPSSRRNAA
jgi:hypothetical protein